MYGRTSALCPTLAEENDGRQKVVKQASAEISTSQARSGLVRSCPPCTLYDGCLRAPLRRVDARVHVAEIGASAVHMALAAGGCPLACG